MSSIRVLVADDYKDWRKQVRLLLQTRPEWRIICEVSDGVEAVQKAEELKPDLVLLDIGLPNMNGIEAARRVRQLSPNSKIVFVSLDNSSDVVEVAMGTGAHGYVYKARAKSDLLPAIDAVLRDEQFVSSMLRGYRVPDPSGSRAPQLHEVLIYSDDEVLANAVAHFVAEALEAGDVAIAIATPLHRDCFFQKLSARGVDVSAAIEEGRYVPVDAAATLCTFMANGMPDSTRLFEVVGGLVKAATKTGKTVHPRLAIFGEGVSILCEEGKTDAAIRLEQLWNQLATTYKIDILCGYPLSSFNGEEAQHVFQSICAEHSAVASR
jgi:DNA-binding NarL/FixJ family response regulator